MTRISRETKAELTRAVRQRYRGSSKGEKTRILDEFVSVSGFHRKHAIRLLSRDEVMPASDSPRVGRKVYDQAVREALVVLWEAADRVCGKRLKPALPSFVDALERHGHLRLQPDVRARVLAISAASIDRLLAPIRNGAGRRTKRGNASEARRRVPVRTFADWNEPMPGFLEIDFVVHGGGSVAGSLIYTLVGTDVSSGWVECVPLVAREQSLVVEGLDVVQKQLPVPLLGIDSDNDGAFINDTLIDYCRAKEIEFTRSRPYRKNDQAWIEQKNGAVVRRLVGHDRYSGVVAGQILARLYQVSRLYTNWFQPSLKLRDKVRDGAKVKKLYHKAATPAERLLKHPKVPLSTKEQLRERQRELDPVGLLHQIRDHQAALAALGSPEEASTGPGRESLEQFLSQLPSLWRAGEARPTHRRALHKPRSWRTREDPFKSVWPEILERLQAEPDATLKPLEELFRARVITFLVDKGLLPPARAKMLRGWVHSGFNVYRSRRVQPSEREDLERLAQYIIRNPFAVEKMQVSPPNRANPDGSVIYRSGLNPKIQRNFEVFSPCDFILLRSASYGGQVATTPRLACPT